MPRHETIRLAEICSRMGYALSRDAVYAAAMAAVIPAGHLLIQIGADPKKSPKLWHTPAVLIFPRDRRDGDTDSQVTNKVIVELRIKEHRDTRDSDGELNLIEHPGAYSLDRFTALTMQALRRAFDGSPVDLDDVNEQQEVEAWYPLMGALITIEARVPQVMGGAYRLPSPRTPVELDTDLAALSVAAGGTVDLQVRLADDPYTPLAITATLTGNAELSIDAGASLSYTDATYGTYQTVTVAASAIATGSGTLTIAPATGATQPVDALTIPITIT